MNGITVLEEKLKHLEEKKADRSEMIERLAEKASKSELDSLSDYQVQLLKETAKELVPRSEFKVWKVFLRALSGIILVVGGWMGNKIYDAPRIQEYKEQKQKMTKIETRLDSISKIITNSLNEKKETKNDSIRN